MELQWETNAMKDKAWNGKSKFVGHPTLLKNNDTNAPYSEEVLILFEEIKKEIKDM